jgi:hypothetical protein
LNKKISQLEKDRKEKEKEDAKKAKENQKLAEIKKKEQAKQNPLSLSDRLAKETIRKNEKNRQQFRRDVNIEVRKNRSDASIAVFQYYDEEEEHEDSILNNINTYKNLNEGKTNIESSLSLKSLIDSFPNIELFGFSTDSEIDLIDSTLLVSNTLNLLKSHLNLEISTKLDNLLSCLSGISNQESSDIDNNEKSSESLTIPIEEIEVQDNKVTSEEKKNG